MTKILDGITEAVETLADLVPTATRRLLIERLEELVEPLLAGWAKFDERIADLQAEYLKREQSWDRTRERLTRERAELLWLHAEAAWLREVERCKGCLEDAATLVDTAAELRALRASAVVLPEDWLHLVERAIAEADGLGPVTVDAATGAIETLVESWLPTAVEATPAKTGIALADELWPAVNPCHCPGSGTHAHVRGCRLHPEANDA